MTVSVSENDELRLTAHQRLGRQPLAGLVEGLLAGQHLQPLNLALAAVCLVHRRVKHVLGGAPDIRTSAVALEAYASAHSRHQQAASGARAPQRASPLRAWSASAERTQRTSMKGTMGSLGTLSTPSEPMEMLEAARVASHARTATREVAAA